MLVRGADLDQGHIQADFIVLEDFGDLGQIHRDIVDLPLKGSLPHADGDEKQLNGKPGQEVLVMDIIGEGVGEHLIDDDILDGRVFHHSPDQLLGLSAAGADEDPAAVADFLDAFLRGEQLFRTNLP